MSDQRAGKFAINFITTSIFVVIIYALLHIPIAIVISCVFGPWGSVLEGTAPPESRKYVVIAMEIILFIAACPGPGASLVLRTW